LNFIKNIFWNSFEKRMRMIWRLIGQLLIMLILTIAFQFLLILFNILVKAIQGTLSSPQYSSFATGVNIATNSPLLTIASLLGSGLVLTLSIWLAGRFLDRRRFIDFGLHINQRWLIDFGFGLSLGAVLMTLIFLFELASGWISVNGTFVTQNPETPFLSAIIIPLTLFLTVGFYEELFSRGYHLTNLAEGLAGKIIKPRTAILLATFFSSAIFAFLHASNPHASLASTLNIGLAGIFLAAGYVLTGQLAIPIALHISWNFFQGNVFGFPVSGSDFQSATFIQINQSGPDLWTGGLFGPEAGLLGTGAMILGLIITLIWIRKQYGRIDMHLPLSEPPATFPPKMDNLLQP
jgi:membrane protease YdiL (CAAX protease family)